LVRRKPMETETWKMGMNSSGVDMRRFGAKGDGITGDTAAIQKVLNQGHSIDLPVGPYRVREPLSVSGFVVGSAGEAPDDNIDKITSGQSGYQQ
jgi:hypothetical protein